MITGLLRHLFSIPVDLLTQDFDGVLTIEELPQEDAGGVQAKATPGVGIKENGPVIKLLA